MTTLPRKPIFPTLHPKIITLTQEPIFPLGTLETLPLELRQHIYMLALARTPITLRTQARSYDSTTSKSLAHRRSRFALLYVSRCIRIEALWVFHNTITLHFKMTNFLEDFCIEHRGREMWTSISKWKNIELVMPSITQPITLVGKLELLVTAIERLMERWKQPLLQVEAKHRKHVTVHLARVFDMRTWWRDDDAVDEALVKDAVKRWKLALERLVRALSKKGGLVVWNVRAMTEMQEDKQKAVGREMVGRVMRKLGDKGVKFIELRDAEVPMGRLLLEATEEKGVFGGLHKRFVY